MMRNRASEDGRTARTGVRARRRIGGIVAATALVAVAALGTAGSAEASTGANGCTDHVSSYCHLMPAGVRWQ